MSQGSLSHVYARGVRCLIIHFWAAATCKEASKSDKRREGGRDRNRANTYVNKAFTYCKNLLCKRREMQSVRLSELKDHTLGFHELHQKWTYFVCLHKLSLKMFEVQLSSHERSPAIESCSGLGFHCSANRSILNVSSLSRLPIMEKKQAITVYT